MVVLHFFLVNSPLIYILFSLIIALFLRHPVKPKPIGRKYLLDLGQIYTFLHLRARNLRPGFIKNPSIGNRFSQMGLGNFVGINMFLKKYYFIRLALYKENRIYIRVEFTRKKCKRPFCCTVSILQVYFTYLRYITFWALEQYFIENLKLILKENQIMK